MSAWRTPCPPGPFLLPVLGLIINLYLMTQLGVRNWAMFFAWLLLGLGIYFGYGYRHSKLNKGLAGM